MCGLNSCQILSPHFFRSLIEFSFHDKSTKIVIYLKVNECLLQNDMFCLPTINLVNGIAKDAVSYHI